VIKQVIVMRTRFPDGKGETFTPRKGKLIAQGAHASMKVFFDRLEDSGDDCLELGPQEGWDWEAVKSWVRGRFTKVVVHVETETELLALAHAALLAGLPHAIIEDNGDTEFHGVPTVTALAIGPADSKDIDPVTGHLKLL
jgi:PTH2 family peptidyl-tRNA hydrolase